MNQYGFVFDSNKCTGCNACQIACILENELDFSASWRQVFTFNVNKLPALAHFHLSLACNHCADPPCMKFCPASAYTKEPVFGSVQIQSNKCLGCNYCSWVCPYDAPEYNAEQGIINKCNFCLPRLEENLRPACVTLCPTDALQLSIIEHQDKIMEIPGFTQTNIGPSIEIKPRVKWNDLPEHPEPPFDDDITDQFQSAQENKARKLSLKSEWPLLTFTVLMPLLVALYFRSALDRTFMTAGINSIAAIAALALSGLHLGKPLRAFRAISNLRKSWLSREIFSFSVFLILIFLQDFFAVHNIALTTITVIAGIFALFCADMVYTVIPRTTHPHRNNIRLLLTGILYSAMFLNLFWIFNVILLIRFLLYLIEKSGPGLFLNPVSLIRIFLGFVVPFIISVLQMNTTGELVIICVLSAEILDRIDFYLQLDIITPKRQMEIDCQSKTKEMTSVG